MLGFVPAAVGRCWSSKGLQLRRCNSVFRQRETPSPHEINIYITKLSHVSRHSVSLCVLVLPISSTRLGTSYLHEAYKYLSTLSLFPLVAVLSRLSSGRRYTHSSL